MRFRSLTNKLATYFVVISLTALFLFVILGYLQSKDAITARTLEQLTSLKNVKKRQLESLFSDLSSLISIISKSSDLHCQPIAGLNYDSEKSTIREYVDQNKYFKRAFLLMRSPSNTLCEVISKKNAAKATAEDLNLFKSINPADNGIIIFEKVMEDSPKTFKVYLASPISGIENYKCGYLIIELNTAVINDIMLETNPSEGIGQSGESYIVASDGFMRTESRFLKSSLMRINIKSDGFMKSLSGISGTGFYKDYRGIEVLGSFSRIGIKGLDWHVIVEIDSEEASKPVVKMRNSLTVLMLIISSVIFGATYLMSKKITDPITNLTKAAEKISLGDYPEPVGIVSEDEIAVLTMAFNEMTDKLKSQEAELEKERLIRAQSAIDALDEERRRLSRELHDGLGQLMIAIKLQLENVDINDYSTADEKIKDIILSTDNIIEEIRHISNNLMPAVLSEFGIINAIRYLCDELNGYSNIKIQFESNLKHEKLSKRDKLYLFRIAQEALINAIQHAGAVRISLKLITRNDEIILSVSDNGKGFDMKSVHFGNGINNMKERAKLMNASLKIEHSETGGTNILLCLPHKELKQ